AAPLGPLSAQWSAAAQGRGGPADLLGHLRAGRLVGAGDLSDRLRLQVQDRHALGSGLDPAPQKLTRDAKTVAAQSAVETMASMRGLLSVTGSWGSVLTGLIPLAAVVPISPLSVIPAVLVLQAPRPRPTGLAFLGGWLLGLVAPTGAFVASSDALSGLHNKPPAWASWTRVVLGLALIAFGIYRWLTREGHTESPKWMRSFETLTPARALATGLALVVVRVEVLTMC